MNQNRRLTASFKKLQFALSLSGGNGGIAQGEGSFYYGENAKILAIPSQGFRFQSWNGTGVENPTSAETTVRMTSSRELQAKFVELEVTNLKGSTEIEADWYESSWLGYFYKSNSSWCYHLQLGWVVPSIYEENNIWLWSPMLDWLWLDSKTFPNYFAWSLSENDWIYFDFENASASRIYHYSDETWSVFNKNVKLKLEDSLF